MSWISTRPADREGVWNAGSNRHPRRGREDSKTAWGAGRPRRRTRSPLRGRTCRIRERANAAGDRAEKGGPASRGGAGEGTAKPSISVWGHQLARRHRKDLDLLLDAGNRLAAAQRALLTGGNRQAFEQAGNDEREALNRLSARARSILTERGSTTTLERLTSTLRAAAVSDAARPDLARERLTSDLDPAGFGAFTVDLATVATPPNPKTRSERPHDDQAKHEQAKRQEATKRAAIARSPRRTESRQESARQKRPRSFALSSAQNEPPAPCSNRRNEPPNVLVSTTKRPRARSKRPARSSKRPSARSAQCAPRRTSCCLRAFGQWRPPSTLARLHSLRLSPSTERE